MFSPLRNRFGIPGVISVIALVFAMLGGAYAASSSEGGQSQASAAKKAIRGPRGPKGPTGPEGPAGTPGAQGATGANGKDGANGFDGANGVSPTATEFAGTKAGHCTAGGVEIKGTSTNYVCNGEEGVPGDPGEAGSPWVAGQAPSGVVLKGTWSLPPYTAAAASEDLFIEISTGVPLSTSAPFPIFPSLAPSEDCTGTAAAPTPPPVGALVGVCLYADASSTNLTPTITASAGKLNKSGGGLVVRLKSAAAGLTRAYGTWAMRAP